jgi:hypothetical protein
MRYIKQNDLQSASVLHILYNMHEYGPIDDTLSLLKQVNTGPLMNLLRAVLIQSQ